MVQPTGDSSDNATIMFAPTGNENSMQAVMPRPIKNQIAPQIQHDGEEVKLGATGKDLDQESTTQNFYNVTREGAVSPREIEKKKSTSKGRKKQQKDHLNIQAGV